MPPSKRPHDARINTISSAELASYFNELSNELSIPETEDSWQKLDKSLVKLQAITKGGATKFPDYVANLKAISQPINNSLLSERTKLSGTAGDLINSVAPRLAEKFEGLVNVFVPTLLLICARTNKVAVKRAEKSLHMICRHCKLASVVPLLKEAAKDKGQGLRAVATGAMLILLESTEKEKLNRRVTDIEACIKAAATDSNVEVRQTSKKLFELYVSVWPERVEMFTKPLTPTIRRYLALPKTGALIVDIPPASVAKLAPSHAPQEVSSSTSRPAASSSSTSRSGPAASRSATMASASEASIKRSLFAEQIAAARAQHKASRADEARESKPAYMAAPTEPRRKESNKENDHAYLPHSSSSSSTFRASRSDANRPTASTSARSATRAQNFACSINVQPNPPSGSLSSSTNSRPLSASTNSKPLSASLNGPSTPSFALASGMRGSSKLLAAYSQAFNREHTQTSSQPDLRERAQDSSAPQRSRSGDSTPSSDPVIRSQAEEEAAKSAPSDGVAERLVLAQEMQLAKEEEPAEPTETPKPSALHASTGPSQVKASRVITTRPAGPPKVSAVRVTRPPPPSVSKPAPSSLRASTNSTGTTPPARSTPAPTKSNSSTKKPEIAPMKPKAVPSKAATPRAIVISAASLKKFQPKLSSRTKVTSSVSASMASKSKLLGGGDKDSLIKKASLNRKMPESKVSDKVPEKVLEKVVTPTASLVRVVARTPLGEKDVNVVVPKATPSPCKLQILTDGEGDSDSKEASVILRRSGMQLVINGNDASDADTVIL